MDPNRRGTQKVHYDWVSKYCAKEPPKPAHMGNKGKVVKKIWHKKSPNNAHRKAISMLAGTLVTTQEKQWQNVK
ncbi:hypothetical protein H5410_047100, partial [Solanum commersonii]